MKKDRASLMDELAQGVELTKLLRSSLDPDSSSSKVEERQILIQRIQSSYEKAISILTCGELSPTETKPKLSCSGHGIESFDPDRKNEFVNTMCKKRKFPNRKTETVKLCHNTDDGYCWRKYGQKEILGSRFPRAYYRCTHRFSQGCLATKQIQKSDKDPALVEVTYIGTHRCTKQAMPPSGNNCQNQPKMSGETISNFKAAKEEAQFLKQEIFRTFSLSRGDTFEDANVSFAAFGENDEKPTTSPLYDLINNNSHSPTSSVIEDLDFSVLDYFDLDFGVELVA